MKWWRNMASTSSQSTTPPFAAGRSYCVSLPPPTTRWTWWTTLSTLPSPSGSTMTWSWRTPAMWSASSASSQWSLRLSPPARNHSAMARSAMISSWKPLFNEIILRHCYRHFLRAKFKIIQLCDVFYCYLGAENFHRRLNELKIYFASKIAFWETEKN